MNGIFLEREKKGNIKDKDRTGVMLKKVIAISYTKKVVESRHEEVFKALLKEHDFDGAKLRSTTVEGKTRSSIEIETPSGKLIVPNYLANEIMDKYDELVQTWAELALKSMFPPEFKSSITLGLLVSPYINSKGHTCNKDEIDSLNQSTHPQDPLTRESLKDTEVYFNYHVLQLVYLCFSEVIATFEGNNQTNAMTLILDVWIDELKAIDPEQEIGANKFLDVLEDYRRGLH
jgi:hypothetical protein